MSMQSSLKRLCTMTANASGSFQNAGYDDAMTFLAYDLYGHILRSGEAGSGRRACR